jgi:hypothetical protein
MKSQISLEELEASIEQLYDRYSAKKVALAAFMVGVFTIGFSYVAYALTAMPVLAIIVFGVVGFLSVNLTMVFVVPPSKKLAESREFICAAMHDPLRIKAINANGVKLADKTGEVRALNGLEMDVWTSKIVPYFMQAQAVVQPTARKESERKYTASERKYIEDRRKEVLEIEKKIEEERKRLDLERKDIDKRSAELKEMERMLGRTRLEEGYSDVLPGESTAEHNS